MLTVESPRVERQKSTGLKMKSLPTGAPCPLGSHLSLSFSEWEWAGTPMVPFTPAQRDAVQPLPGTPWTLLHPVQLSAGSE